MADYREHSPEELYRQWRAGNAEAGGAMAQRFTDWYYSIALARVGDAQGRPMVRRACERFEKGIVEVPTAAELLPWAHRQIAEEYVANPRLPQGADTASKFTGGRRPGELLAQARTALPAATVRLLDLTYGPGSNLDEISTEAEKQGGMPLSILTARHTLKRWLRDTTQVPFAVIPDNLNLDCAPLPLYEAGRMAAQGEEPEFEKWLLSDIELCRDIAEFADFAHALRAGGLRGGLGSAPEAAPPPAVPPKAPAEATKIKPEAPSRPVDSRPVGSPPDARPAAAAEPPATPTPPEWEGSSGPGIGTYLLIAVIAVVFGLLLAAGAAGLFLTAY